MLKKIFLLLFLSVVVIASDKIEIFATSMDTEGEIVYAKGEVNVVYQDYYISSKHAKYNKTTGELEFFENVRMSKDGEYKVIGEYARINIKEKEKNFKPFYLLEKSSLVWISSKDAYEKNKKIKVEDGMVSGCNPNDPLWKMEFTSSDYDSNDKWLNMYNTKLYIYDIPIFYMPYFGYSLDNSRQTGLLRPSVGFSSDEGFYYKQSLYLALQNWWDLEITPQYRSKRGSGVYSTFRFVDSNISQGKFVTGYFKEQDSYFEKNNLANQEHFGFDFSYYNSDFINQWFRVDAEGQSAVYVDLHYLNDVDYINLASNDAATTSTAIQALSKINLFYNEGNHYVGAYFKHYQDLTIEDNSKTLHQMPTLQYHYYLDTLFKDHFLYNLDLKSSNIFRQEGIGVIQTDVNIPLTIQSSFFDDYINIAFKTFLYAQLSSFKDKDKTTNLDLKNGYYARNYNVLKGSTSVTRAFDEYTHVVGFGTSYIFSAADGRSGYYENQKDFCSDINNKLDDRCEFYNISDINEAIELEFSQYIFDSFGNQKLYHKLTQNIIFQGDGNENYDDLENELNYQVTSELNLYNNLFYNYDNKAISKIYNSVSYNDNGFNVSLSHLYENNFKEIDTLDNPKYTNYMTSNVRYDYNEHYSYNVVYNYDIERNLKKNMEIGFMYSKRCWEFGLKYLENNRPILTANDASSVYDRYIYFTILLKPIMESGSSSSFSYRLPKIYNAQGQ